MNQNTYSSFKQGNTVCEKLIRAIQTSSPFRTSIFTSQQNREDAVVPTASSPNVSLMTRTPAKDRCARIIQQSVAPLDKKKNSGGTVNATATPPRVSLMTPTPPRDRCPRVLKQPDNQYGSSTVPVMFDQRKDHSTGSNRKLTNKVAHADQPNINQPKPKAAVSSAQGKPTVLPIHGFENRLPTMSHISDKSSVAESVNGMFTEYIDRAGRKIRCPTNVGVRNPSMRPDSFNDKVSDFISRAKHKFHTAPSFVDASPREELRRN